MPAGRFRFDLYCFLAGDCRLSGKSVADGTRTYTGHSLGWRIIVRTKASLPHGFSDCVLERASAFNIRRPRPVCTFPFPLAWRRRENRAASRCLPSPRLPIRRRTSGGARRHRQARGSPGAVFHVGRHPAGHAVSATGADAQRLGQSARRNGHRSASSTRPIRPSGPPCKRRSARASARPMAWRSTPPARVCRRPRQQRGQEDPGRRRRHPDACLRRLSSQRAWRWMLPAMCSS